jgi:hypothetical protein
MLIVSLLIQINSIEKCIEKSKIYEFEDKIDDPSDPEHILSYYLTNKQENDSEYSEFTEFFPGESFDEDNFGILQTNKIQMENHLRILEEIRQLNDMNLDSGDDHTKRPVTNPQFQTIISEVKDDVCIHESSSDQGKMSNSYYLILQMTKSFKPISDYMNEFSFWEQRGDLKSRISLYSSILYKYNIITTRNLKYCKLSSESLFYDSQNHDILLNNPFSFQYDSMTCPESESKYQVKPAVLEMNLDLTPKIYRFEVLSLTLLFIQLELKFLQSKNIDISKLFGNLYSRLNQKGSELKIKLPKKEIFIFEFIDILFEKIDYFDKNVYMPWNMRHIKDDLDFLITKTLEIVKKKRKTLFKKNQKQLENYHSFWNSVNRLINKKTNFYKKPKILEVYMRTQIILDSIIASEMKVDEMEYTFLK